MGKKRADPNKGRFIANSDFSDYADNIDYSQYVENNSPAFTGGDLSTNTNYDSSRYDPNTGVFVEDLPNLENIRAENQGVAASLGTSAVKFLGKTGLNVLGGVVGTIYGGGSAIVNGDISKLWDNTFLDKVDAIDKDLGDIFKVYRTSDYENQNFLQRMFLHPLQFTDDATEALSFTAGAILTEMLTSGIATESILPRALRYMKVLGRGAEAAEATAQLTSTSSKLLRGLGESGTLLKKLATGASYESIVESRQATMQLRDKMYADWETEHPNEDMPDDIRQDIDDRLSKAGLFTYLTNLALVGSSNLVQFPKLFGLGYRTSRNLEGSIARNVETGLFEAANTTSRLSRVASALKNPLYEGLVEEGLQNVTSGTARQYWDRKNDLDAKDNSNGFLQIFAENLAKTYTSKEGWNDIGMGMLIGGLGAPGRGALSVLGRDNPLGQYGFEEARNEQGEVSGYNRGNFWEGGLFGTNVEAQRERQEVADIIDDLNKNTNIYSAMKANYDALVVDKSLERDKEAFLEAGDIFEFNNAKDDQIHNFVSSRVKAGLSEEIDDTISDMRKLSSDDFYTEFRGEEAASKATNVEKIRFQQESIQEFEQKANNTREAIQIADDIYKGNNEDLREELVHAIAASKNLDTREKAINQALADLSNGFISDIALRGIDSPEVEQDLINNFVQNNPTEATLNGNTIKELLNDSRRLRRRRQSYLDLYNNLFTPQGQEIFEKYQTDRDTAIAQEEQQIQVEEAEKVREEEKKVNNQATVEKAERVKSEPVPTDEIPNVNFEDALTDTPTIDKGDPIYEFKQTRGSHDKLQVGDFIDDNEVVDITRVEEGKNYRRAGWIGKVELRTLDGRTSFRKGDSLSGIVYRKNFPIETTEELDTEEEQIVEVENHKVTEETPDGEVKNITNEQEYNPDNLEYINGDMQRTIGNTIAYLGINRASTSDRTDSNVITRSFDIFDADGNVEINEFVDTKLFSRNYYRPGDKVNLIVPSFEQMEVRGLQDYTREDFDKNSNSIGEFPIAVTNSDNTIVGYLPTQSNINRLVAEEFREEALASNLALREKIFNNKSGVFTNTITSKSPGFLITDSIDNQRNLFDALGNGSTNLAKDVSITIGKLGDIYTSAGSRYNKGNIINRDSIKDGIVYSIVPSSKQDVYIAYPMRVNTIGTDNANTIVEVLRLFAKGKNYTQEEKQSLTNIGDYNFSNFNDIVAFVNKIMYANSSNKATEQTIFRLYKDNLILSKFDDSKKYKLSDIVSKQSIRDEIASILSERYSTVSLNNLNSNESYYEYRYNTESGIITENEYTNYLQYLNDNRVITSNIRGINIEGNEYAFTAQPVIGLSDSIDTPVVTGDEAVRPERTERMVVSEKKTTRTLFDPSKLKPKSLDDITPEFLAKQSVTSAEDLMKKCL